MSFQKESSSKRMTWIPDPPKDSAVINMGSTLDLIFLNLPLFKST
jgi:hypothetical protein